MAILADQDDGKPKGAAPGTTKKEKAQPGKGERVSGTQGKTIPSSEVNTKGK